MKINTLPVPYPVGRKNVECPTAENLIFMSEVEASRREDLPKIARLPTYHKGTQTVWVQYAG